MERQVKIVSLRICDERQQKAKLAGRRSCLVQPVAVVVNREAQTMWAAELLLFEDSSFANPIEGDNYKAEFKACVAKAVATCPLDVSFELEMANPIQGYRPCRLIKPFEKAARIACINFGHKYSTLK